MSRELDAQVAELMGWENLYWMPHYSRDIAAAMQVVEKMHQDDFWWSASYKETYVDEIFKAGYSVTFRCVRAGTRGDHTATDLTLSEAICKAAVMAKAE